MPARVLVVDDIAPNRRLLEAKLSREFFEVITACNGIEALEKIHEFHPDIVLLDVMMPEMDGFETCRNIRDNPEIAHIPVIMVTALSNPQDRIQGLQAGADEFLSKPVHDLELFARVRSLLRLKAIMDEWSRRDRTARQFGGEHEVDLCYSQVSSHGAHLLVLASRPEEGERISDILKEDEIGVDYVKSPAAFLHKAQTGNHDLLLISEDYGEDAGPRLCTQLRLNEGTKRKPILYMTEQEGIERIAHVLDIGVNDYIVRPVDQHELLARVRTQVRRKRFQDFLQENYEEEISLVLKDPLTGLFNRRYVDRHLPRLMDDLREKEKGLAIFMVDLDHFKRLNDTLGHAAGDEALRAVGNCLSGSVRDFDMIARIGGEEFIVVMLEADEQSTKEVAERLRLKISELNLHLGEAKEHWHLTTSVGVALMDGSISASELIDKADKALYQAKQNGRNQTVVASNNEKPASIGAAG